MKRRKRKPSTGILLLGVLLLVVGFFGLREVYQRIYSHRTHVITGTEPYTREADFRAVALYEQDVIKGKGIRIDPDADGKRIGAHQRIGRADAVIAPMDATVPTQEAAIRWIREQVFSQLQPAPKQAEQAAATEDTEEETDTFASTLPLLWFHIQDNEIILDRSAFVSARTDGYENRLSYEHLHALRPEEVRALLAESVSPAATDAFTLINDHTYALAVLTEEKYDDDPPVQFRVGEDLFTGDVVHTEDDETGRLIVYSLDEGFQKIYPQRFVEGQLLLQQYEAFTLPVSAWIEKDGQGGVYIRNNDAVVEFVPLTAVQRKDKLLYVDTQETDLAVYDEVFLHPDAVKEGDFIE